MSDLRSAPVPPLRADDHVRGPAGAPLVVFYGDYACPRCALAHARLRAVEDDVRLVFRHFALKAKHPRALALAHAAEAAGGQGAFWPFHDSLYEEPGRVDDPHLWARCERLGLDVERFEADRRAPAVAERVRRDVRDALRAGATGTPALWAQEGRDLPARLARFGLTEIKTMGPPTDGRAEKGQPHEQ
jgi:protein-disulfide isomerase